MRYHNFHVEDLMIVLCFIEGLSLEEAILEMVMFGEEIAKIALAELSAVSNYMPKSIISVSVDHIGTANTYNLLTVCGSAQ